jgi:hypothetical protein
VSTYCGNSAASRSAATREGKLKFPSIMDGQSFREFVTDAIRFWEPLRVAYNVVLAAIVLAYFVIGYPASRANVTVDGILLVILLAVLANVAFCAAYIPDVFAQASGYRETWRKVRWVLFAIGLLFASILTRFWAMGMFALPNK